MFVVIKTPRVSVCSEFVKLQGRVPKILSVDLCLNSVISIHIII